jgi:hypothetical protein
LTTRERIERRARGRCEYCQASQEICGYTFHIEHIVAKKRGGADGFENYALSCASCNLFKGDWPTGIDPETETEQSLFNPRAQKWKDHFEWSADFLDVLGKTPVGRATVARMKMNIPIRREARNHWLATDVWP